MRIAIASGKGGTGKTTLAVNLASYLAGDKQYKVNFIDCDVEEPNSHFFLQGEWDFEEIAIDSIEKYYSFENYLSYTDGDESATLTCPECFHETYIYHEQSCAFCGYSAEHECQRCSIDIPSCEIDGSGFCSWCQKMMSNDD